MGKHLFVLSLAFALISPGIFNNLKKEIKDIVNENIQQTTWTTLQTSAFSYEVGTNFDFEKTDPTYELKKFKIRAGWSVNSLQLVFTDGSNNMKTVSLGGNGGNAY